MKRKKGLYSVDDILELSSVQRVLKPCETELEKAVQLFLHFSKVYTLTIYGICKHFDINKKRLKNGIWAFFNGFPVGAAYRPRYLNPSEEIELSEFISER